MTLIETFSKVSPILSITVSIATVILSFLLGKLLYLRKWHEEEISTLKATIYRYKMADDDTHPGYAVGRIVAEEKDHRLHEYNGVWAVYRCSTQNGMIHLTCIKTFTDPDDDFNHREATELCDILNSK